MPRLLAKNKSQCFNLMTQAFSSFLRKWHVRIGMSSAIVLLMLAVTGILINHSQQMSLADKGLPAWLANLFYGLDESVVQSLQVGQLSAEAEAGELEISTSGFENSTPCDGIFVGARRFSEEVWFACEQQIAIYLIEDARPHFAELLNSYAGLPAPIQGFGSCNLAPCIIVEGQTMRYSPSQFSWSELPSESTENFWSRTPDSETRLAVAAEHNWERWLLDLHSGRLFGTLGLIIVDATAIAILLLVFSGLLRWLRAR